MKNGGNKTTPAPPPPSTPPPHLPLPSPPASATTTSTRRSGREQKTLPLPLRPLYESRGQDGRERTRDGCTDGFRARLMSRGAIRMYDLRPYVLTLLLFLLKLLFAIRR